MQKSIDSYPNELPSFSAIFDVNGSFIADSANQVEGQRNPLLHSEWTAIQNASQTLKSKYLDNCILITGLEPCLHCAGSIIKARISHVVYFVSNDQGDGISNFPPEMIYQLNHFPKLELMHNSFVLNSFRNFFKNKRN